MSDPFPPGFFDRQDESPDPAFYGVPRLLTHIDDQAIEAVGLLYEELGIDGSGPPGGHVLDLMSSWISHLRTAPAELTVLGLNQDELDANPMATARVVQDLNVEPTLPFADATFTAATCCVSVDYLTRPVEVFQEVARVLRPGAPFVITFSNRCFPTKAIRGWLANNDQTHCRIVGMYFTLAGGFGEIQVARRTPAGIGDPLFAVWAAKA